MEFRTAVARDDAAIRRLLRRSPMDGGVRLSLQREPSYFGAARIEGPEHHAIVAVEGERVVCVGAMSVRQRFINGKPTRVGYLSGLRLDPACRGRAAIVRRGYECFRRVHEEGGPPLYFTSIMADNLPARRLLERGLPGMPTYRCLGEFVTLLLPVHRRGPAARSRLGEGIDIGDGAREHVSALVELLNRERRGYHFAPVCSEEDFQHVPESGELRPEDVRVLFSRADGKPRACAAIWDQRAIKQAVVCGYPPGLRRWRPIINCVARVLRIPTLPPVGSQLLFGYVSHVAADSAEEGSLPSLIRALQSAAQTRKMDYIAMGLDARDPRLPQVRKAFRARECLSRLYAVFWEDGADMAHALDDRLLGPELALL